MPIFNNKNMLVAGVVGAVVIGGILLYSSGAFKIGNREKTEGAPQEQQEVLSIAGKVASVNVAENSFMVLQSKEEREFTVKLGEETEFIRLIFPFDVANPPANATFTPERKIITIADLKENDQVFVRASSAIKTKQDIVNPLEVQILP